MHKKKAAPIFRSRLFFVCPVLFRLRRHHHLDEVALVEDGLEG